MKLSKDGINPAVSQKSGGPKRPVVGVIGASGNVGRATVVALASQFASEVNIRAIVRDPQKATNLTKIPGVVVMPGEMGGNHHMLKKAFTDLEALFIVAPGVEDRAKRVVATIEVSKAAGVKFLVVLSIPAADRPDTTFGAEFARIEKSIKSKAVGIPFALLRLPFFVDNFWVVKETAPQILMPIEPGQAFTPVTIADVGQAAACILANPAKHKNKTYSLASERITMAQVASTFSEVLGRPLTYNKISIDEFAEDMKKRSISDWQINGTKQLISLINEGSPLANFADMSDFEKITGKAPTTVKDWLTGVKEWFSQT